MAIKERINPKTNAKEYKVRYYFMRDGKKRDSETAWMPSKKEAEAEAKRLKALKEQKTEVRRRDIPLSSAFDKYIEELEHLSTRQTTENTSTAKSLWKRATTIKRKYMPAEVAQTPCNQISVSTFRDWLNAINRNTEISGSYVRNLKALLSQFNKWLRDNGYYIDRNLDLDIDIALTRTTIKPKGYRNRESLGERNILTISQVGELCSYYWEQNLGIFENFYYYTLFYVLFYSGMRVEELVGLQWRFINLEDSVRTISIENAISEREVRENALERVKRGIYRTKNNSSKRLIPIFDYYYELLIDYKMSYRAHFGLNKEDMGDCFVFPNLKSPHLYQSQKTILRHLKKAVEAKNLPKTDSQMLRHSCATFLVLPQPEGMGFAETQVIDYFGHTDTEMLKHIYAKINKQQKSKRMRNTFSTLYNPTIAQSKEMTEDERLMEIFNGERDNSHAKISRAYRIFTEIAFAIERGDKVYYYLEKDKELIDFLLERQEDLEKQIRIEVGTI